LVVVMAACSGSSRQAGHPGPSPGAAAPEKMMQFELAAAGYPKVSASLPGQPLGVSGSSISGLDLEVWSLIRSGDKAMLLIVALHNPGTSPVKTGIEIGSLSASRDAAKEVAKTVSGISAVDGSGLKQYLPYMVNAADDNTCLCSAFSLSDFTPDQRDYYAALLASPPPGVKNLTIVTGLGSVANVPLS